MHDFKLQSSEFIKLTYQVFQIKLKYTQDDIHKIDYLIELNWPKSIPTDLEDMVLLFGSYFGECTRKNLGGDWEYKKDDGWCLVNINSKETIYPFSTIRKRFVNGMQDSISNFYDTLKNKTE